MNTYTTKRSFSPRTNAGGRDGGERRSGSRDGERSGGSRGGSSFRPRSGGSRFGGARSSGPRPFNAKRSFKKDYIDEKLFINKAVAKADAEVYVNKHTFKDFGVHESLAKNLIAKGFDKPSPIQDQAIPVALTGRDVIGIASTGTGKTAAFLIPIINKLVADRNHKAMVLAPTRELAQQIETEFLAFSKGMRLWSVTCVGGSPIYRQISELSRGVHIVIGTPGRVKDLIARNKIRMTDYNTIVLDEADRMLDMGFVGDMREILGAMPVEKQALFFSATLSAEVRRLCGDFLRDPVSVTVKTRDTSSSVEQTVVKARGRDEKITLLHDILIKPEANKVIIFRETKRSVDELARELRARGFVAVALHGDMRNRERERAVEALAKGQAHILIATDVAARGIDIPDISHVINYDLPNNYETYIHRIGRTGRANKTGNSITFV